MSMALLRQGILQQQTFLPSQLTGLKAWYDPSDLSTLYQTNDTSTPVTADGQTVGRMEDKSGNGNHLTQATASKRPLYKTSGGLHWVETDGVDDFLTIAPASFPDVLQPDTIALGYRPLTVTGTKQIFDGAAPTIDRQVGFQSGTGLSMYAGSSASSGLTVASGTDYVLLFEFNGTSSILRRNGTQSAALSPGSDKQGGFEIAASNGVGNIFTARYYSIVIVGNILNSADKSDLEEYIAVKSGVLL